MKPPPPHAAPMKALVTALLAALLLPAALATHEPMGWCQSEVPPGIVEVTTGSEDDTYYVDVRQPAELGVWLYEESNGVWTPRAAGAYRDDAAAHNLQRGGASDLGTWEVCVDDPLELPDTLLW